MCEACEHKEAAPPSGQRRRIWELSGGWHCAVIGTCLTLGDLRALARKLRVKTNPDFSADYQLHGFFVKAAEQAEKPAKLLNKLLEKRHATAIRKARAMKTEAALSDYWTSSRKIGDIPGPYWAILSHPAATQALSERMFADVHMLSHLVGASNRADIRRLQDMEDQTVQLEAKLAKHQRHHHAKLADKDREIAELQQQLREAAAAPAPPPPLAAPEPDQRACANTSALQHDLARLNAAADTAAQTIADQRRQIAALEELVGRLRVENASLEQALTDDGPAADDGCPFDLGGRCLLYVGGRQQTVHHLRSLVEEWNGRFLHHDGGIERSIDELASAVTKADAVVFPTDCISHSAANKVKRLCHQTMKPFVPLRSSGVASFVAGLKDGLVDDVAET